MLFSKIWQKDNKVQLEYKVIIIRISFKMSNKIIIFKVQTI
jgi:hypothetical protein